jgi:hypothetical protein
MNRTRISAALLTTALAAAALPSFADVIERTTTYYVAPTNTSDDGYYYYYDPAPRTTYYQPSYQPYYEPTVVEVYEAPAITVTAPYMTDDQAITSDVMDNIASNPRISGNIGVETEDRDVKLTGMVTTPGQARRAEQDARSVDGVRNVDNGIRSKVGGSY